MDIWKEAPEGATHYNPVSNEFMRIENKQWVVWAEGEWEWVIPSVKQRSKIIKRPPADETGIPTAQDNPQEWSGEGYPPVNTLIKVRLKSSGSSWHQEIAYIDGDSVVFYENTTHTGTWHADTSDYEFLPLKTPEQLAAEKEREEWIKQAAYHAYSCSEAVDDDFFGGIYDWLKSEGSLDAKGDV